MIIIRTSGVPRINKLPFLIKRKAWQLWDSSRLFGTGRQVHTPAGKSHASLPFSLLACCSCRARQSRFPQRSRSSCRQARYQESQDFHGPCSILCSTLLLESAIAIASPSGIICLAFAGSAMTLLHLYTTRIGAALQACRTQRWLWDQHDVQFGGYCNVPMGDENKPLGRDRPHCWRDIQGDIMCR